MAPPDDHREPPFVLRLLLGLIVVGIPAAGVMAWSAAPLYEVLWVRGVFSAMAGVLLVGTVVDGPWRGRIRELTIVLSWALQAWFLWIARQHQMSFDDVFGLLPLMVLTAVLVRRPIELLVSLGWFSGCIALAYAGLADPVFPLPIVWLILSAILVPLGSMSITRHRLETALREANQHLEQRIEERTAELVASEEEAQRASAAKSVFLANMSHELRTPITTMLGYTELALEDLSEAEQPDPQVEADLGRSIDAAKHLLAMVDDLLDIARIEHGSLELERMEVAVSELIAGAAGMVAAEVDAAGNQLVIRVEPGLTVEADPRRLKQVLVNLLSNAAKFTSEGSITVRAWSTGDAVHIAVEDTGIGIEPEALESIFDRFAMADPSSTRVHGGAGLGLALSHDIMSAMGGRIEVVSTPGSGSRFTAVM